MILAYHRVLPRKSLRGFPYLEDLVTPLESFSAQMELLSRRFRVVPLEELIRGLGHREAPPEFRVSITFDDGYADNYRHAFPVLARHGLPATIFLATGHLGGGRGLFWWDEVARWRATGVERVEIRGIGRRSVASLAGRDHLLEDLKRLPLDEIVERVREVSKGIGLPPDPAAAGEFLTWDEVREMRNAGITFGAHTVTHCLLPRETPERRSRELRQSRDDVERETGRPCTLFCYPNGVFDEETRKEVRAAGYEAAVAALPRDVTPGMDLYHLPRKIVNYRAGPTVFRFRLSPHPVRIKRLLDPATRRTA